MSSTIYVSRAAPGVLRVLDDSGVGYSEGNRYRETILHVEGGAKFVFDDGGRGGSLGWGLHYGVAESKNENYDEFPLVSKLEHQNEVFRFIQEVAEEHGLSSGIVQEGLFNDDAFEVWEETSNENTENPFTQKPAATRRRVWGMKVSKLDELTKIETRNIFESVADKNKYFAEIRATLQEVVKRFIEGDRK